MNNPKSTRVDQVANIVGPRVARWLATAIGALAFGTAIAALPLKTIEECLETGTAAVNLPSVAGGSLSASPCNGCPTLRLRFDGRTRYFIGKGAVSYAQLREAASKDDDLRLDLFYHPKTRTLTRMRLAAVGNGQ